MTDSRMDHKYTASDFYIQFGRLYYHVWELATYLLFLTINLCRTFSEGRFSTAKVVQCPFKRKLHFVSQNRLTIFFWDHGDIGLYDPKEDSITLRIRRLFVFKVEECPYENGVYAHMNIGRFDHISLEFIWCLASPPPLQPHQFSSSPTRWF